MQLLDRDVEDVGPRVVGMVRDVAALTAEVEKSKKREQAREEVVAQKWEMHEETMKVMIGLDNL